MDPKDITKEYTNGELTGMAGWQMHSFCNCVRNNRCFSTKGKPLIKN
jgi:hypothetical protein